MHRVFLTYRISSKHHVPTRIFKIIKYNLKISNFSIDNECILQKQQNLVCQGNETELLI